jgi:hypothetical protein
MVSTAMLAPTPVGMTGTATATHDADCTHLDRIVAWGTAMGEQCEYHDTAELDGDQTGVDIYSEASGLKATRQTATAPFDNYLNDSESVAWMKAQSAVAEAYEDGKTKSEAKVAARRAIEDYYSTKQINLIESWNVTTVQVYDLHQVATNESNVDDTLVDPVGSGTYWESTNPGSLADQPSPRSVTLVNGSTYQSKVIAINLGTNDDGFAYPANDPNNAGAHADGIVIRPPTDTYDTLNYLTFQDYQDRWNRIENLKAGLIDESDNFVNATWDDYDSGQINASDVISSNTAMFEYGPEVVNGSGGLYASTAALSTMGFDTPDLNSTGTMTISYNGANYTGLVMARNAPNNTWSTGTTYNASNISGPVFILTTEGEKVDIADGDTFTVTGMTSKAGDQIDSAQTTNYVYRTANTSELLAMQEDLSQLRAEIEARQQSAGGTSGSGSVPIEALGIGLLAVAGLALLAGRENNGRNGGGGSW